MHLFCLLLLCLLFVVVVVVVVFADGMLMPFLQTSRENIRITEVKQCL